MYSKDEMICINMLESVNKILEITKKFINIEDLTKDYIPLDACLMNFIVIGEMAGKLSDGFKEKYDDVEWNKIYTFRNIIAHDYFGVDEKVVWEIIQKKIPELKIDLENILKQ